MSNTPGISPITPDIEEVRRSGRDDEPRAPDVRPDPEENAATDVVPGRDGEIVEQNGP